MTGLSVCVPCLTTVRGGRNDVDDEIVGGICGAEFEYWLALVPFGVATRLCASVPAEGSSCLATTRGSGRDGVDAELDADVSGAEFENWLPRFPLGPRYQQRRLLFARSTR